MEKDVRRLVAFSAIWLAADNLDEIPDFVSGMVKQRIKNVSKDILRIENQMYSKMDLDGLADQILIQNICIEKLIQILNVADTEKVNKLFEALELTQYVAKDWFFKLI